jgi:hypothetical protein
LFALAVLVIVSSSSVTSTPSTVWVIAAFCPPVSA